ncbi:hypothetical protein H072_6644 [Dactylellina haptotyla CBS 200.50]|uniref:WSC domain-containing protein n=1 Tax=Dactylellina haptotyla (strain CBS 200.50) TaxID=1284197 RepID=S8A957_DACHA|nr:hypothetical protein H072_6644 [Dactylellina haptotyla CBS 200.50]
MRFAHIFKRAVLALSLSLKFASALAPTDEIQDADGLQSGYLDNHNLSPDIVNDPGFGILWQISTGSGTDELFFAKPLVYTPPSTGRQVVITASAKNNVYIIDALNGTIITSRQLAKPFKQADLGCSDVQPYIGIMGTPVIDPATDTIYLFSKSYADTSTSGAEGVVNGRYRVYALSALTLADKFGFPLLLDGAQADNDPQKFFMGGTHMQRPSLAMVNGLVWAGFASHCDQYNYTGWVTGIDPSTPKVVSLFSTISGPYSIAQKPGSYAGGAGGGGAGIWQAGMGFSSDRSDRFFLVTANGYAHENQAQARSGKNPPGTLEECIVSFKIDPDTKKIKPQDFFQPYEYLNLDNADRDFGSSGFTMLDPSVFKATGVTRMGVTGGKNGKVYLVNADDLGGYKMGSGGGDAVLQTLTPPGGSIFGGIASYPKEGGYIYAASPNYNTIVYSFGKDSSGRPVFTQVGATAEVNAQRVGVGIPTITSMNGQTGTGILWLTDIDNGLRAWNAVPNADGTMTRLSLPPVTFVGKWQRPAFGDGKVYVAGSNGKITCLGAPINLPLTCTPMDFGELTVGNTKTLNVQCQANIAITSFKGLNISPGLYFRASNSSLTAKSLAKGQNITIPVTLDLTTSGQKYTPGAITSSLQIMTNNGVAGYTSQQPVGLSAKIISSSAFLQLQPLEISFGGVVWGSQQQTDGTLSSMYIKNLGTQPLTILNYVYTKTKVDEINSTTQWTNISPPSNGGLWYLNDGFEADFPAPGSTISPGVNVAVELKFQPTHTGDFSTWVAVNTTAGYAIFAMSGTSSTAPIGLLQMKTNEGGVSNNKFYDFGTVYGGTVQTATIIISNTGGSPLQITKSKPPGQPELYATHPGDEFTEGQFIAASTNATGTVAFAPFKRTLVNQNPVVYTDYWVLNTNGDSFNGPYEVAFTGTVITKQVGPKYSNGTGRYKYLGCYLDGTSGRIAPNKYTFQGTNENGLCQQTCSNNGYAFALSEYAYECWCGNTVPATSLKGVDNYCGTPCPGDGNQTCGGDGGYATAWYDSQRYDPTTNLLDGVYARPPGFQQTAGDYTFYGCWSDSTASRSLKGKATSGSSVNITWCANYCSGYTWMGTSYGNECYCGNDLGGVMKPLSDCNMLCTADQYSYCGAGSRLSLYLRNGTSIPTTTASSATSASSTTSTAATGTSSSTVSGWDYVSCWTDDVGNRSLQDSSYAADDNTLTKCSNFCSGFKYFGVEYSTECYCGNTLGGSSAAEADCYKNCASSTEKCGGDNRLNLYMAKAGATTTATSATPSSTLWVDMGCYKDYTGNRTLIGKSTTSTSNSAAWCYNYCNGFGFKYFGTEYANECYCGNDIVGTGAPVSSGCSYKCAGDQNQFCGGSNRMNMYMVAPASSGTTPSAATTSVTTTSRSSTTASPISTSSTTTSTAPAGPTIVASRGNFVFLSCWTDRTDSRALAGWGLDPADNMTVEKCIDFCAPTKQYVGVEDGRECWCGDSLLSGESAVNAECSSPCTGAPGEICGGPARLAVYKKTSNNPVTTTSTTTTSSTSSSASSSTITTSAAPAPTIVSTYGSFAFQGCWTDRTDNRALAGWGLDPAADMTVEKCIDFCAPTKQYVGVEDGRECWCGNDILSGTTTQNTDCSTPCGGAPGEICGGPARLALYKKVTTSSTSSISSTSSTTSRTTTSSTLSTTISTTTTTLSPTTTTTSRTTTSTTSTTLSTTSSTSTTTSSTTRSSNLTTTSSTTTSASSTTTVTTSNTTTTTTTSRPISSSSSSSSQSSSPSPTTTTTTTTTTSRSSSTSSSGTSSSDLTTDIPSSAPTGPVHNSGNDNYVRIGCVNEPDSGRAMTGGQNLAGTSSTMGVARCLEFCDDKVWVGLQYGGECWCSSGPVNFGDTVDDSQCNMVCKGNTTEYCGAGRKFDLYQLRSNLTATDIATPSTSTSSTTTSRSSTSTTTTTTVPTTTTTTTRSSTTTQTTTTTTISSSTTTSRSSSSSSSTTTSSTTSRTTASSTTTTTTTTSTASATPSAASTWAYRGCYLDSVNSRTLPNKTKTDTTMTIEYCQSWCMDNYNLPYAGLESAKQCFCSDNIGYDRQPGQTGCTAACAGDSSQICGGSSRLSIYQNTKWSPTVVPADVLGWQYSGCWSEISGRAIRGYSFSSTGMSTSLCISTCKSKGYTVAGLENGNECWCANANLATAKSPSRNQKQKSPSRGNDREGADKVSVSSSSSSSNFLGLREQIFGPEEHVDRQTSPKLNLQVPFQPNYQLPEIFHKDFVVRKDLGQGAWGETALVEVVSAQNGGVAKGLGLKKGDLIVAKRAYIFQKNDDAHVVYQQEWDILNRVRGHRNVLHSFLTHPPGNGDRFGHILTELCNMGDVNVLREKYTTDYLNEAQEYQLLGSTTIYIDPDDDSKIYRLAILPEGFVQEFVLSIAKGLSWMHHGIKDWPNDCAVPDKWVSIMHNDLKANNIFMTARQPGDPCIYPIFKIGDFGASTLLGARAPIGNMLASPERLAALNIMDAVPRDDIFSLGAMAYELLHMYPIYYEHYTQIHMIYKESLKGKQRVEEIPKPPKCAYPNIRHVEGLIPTSIPASIVDFNTCIRDKSVVLTHRTESPYPGHYSKWLNLLLDDCVELKREDRPDVVEVLERMLTMLKTQGYGKGGSPKILWDPHWLPKN